MNIDTNNLIDNVIDWITKEGATIAIILIVAEIINHIIKKVVSRVVDNILAKRKYPTEQDRSQRAKTLKRMFGAASRLMVWLVAIIYILVELGVDVAAIVAGAGFLGLAFGIGAQSLIQDVISGIFIIIENQYRVGDIIEINGQSGEVVDITMRITQLRDIDGNAHFIPNGEIKHTINKSFGYSKINMSVSVAYDSDIDLVEKTINKAGQKLAKSAEFGKYIVEAPEFARVENFGDSGIEIKIFGMVKPGKQWLVAGQLRRELKTDFEKAKIEIPYPHVVMQNKN